MVLGYGLAFYLVSLTLEDLSVGIVYTTWAALGIVGIAAIGVVVFDEAVDPAGIVGIAPIVAGVVVLHGLSDVAAH